MAEKKTKTFNEGVIVRIAGPIVDVYFEGDLPFVYEALTIALPDKSQLTLEVQFEIGDHEVKTIAFGSTDGLARGMSVKRTGSSIAVPVGTKTLGRIFNVLGLPIDGKETLKNVDTDSIHKSPPLLVDQETKPQMLETGIKVIDLIAPFTRGGK
ncbi:MAG TPA: F0F1 ATP synthase subunit beta, partial [Patescibacteria group bacterium]|nr:F0F1 ATP synthase subunit beta [Patescibacteria group bacterium]